MNGTTGGEGVLLFVYGSMKRGHRNHWRIQEAEYLGSARLDVGGIIRPAAHWLFPYLFLDEKSTLRPKGELYRIGGLILDILDVFEGAETGKYRRRTLPVVDADGRVLSAEVYVAIPELETEFFDEGFPLSTWKRDEEALGERMEEYRKGKTSEFV